jgi:hypothetical protein
VLGRDLGALDLGVLMIDGVYIDDRVLLVALGRITGAREGMAELMRALARHENATAGTASRTRAAS